MISKLKISPIAFFIIAMIIAIPAFFINLGDQPMIDDEAIRALVAFEMLEKGDLVTPTIAGEIYLKKPPLYNWLILASFQLFGSYDELVVRIPMILSLFVFTILIFYFFRKEMNDRLAVLVALMFLTSGRILIYESFYGLIDITYSMVIFTFFMHIYRCFMRGNFLWLYLSAYLLIAIAFLMKGLPSIAFLGITLLVLFVSNKKFKLLFHWSHFLGMLLFILIVGGYYFLYFSRNSFPALEMLDVVLGESTRRTIVRFGFWETVLHILIYPLEVIYHFLPWGLLALLFIKKGSLRLVIKNPFMRYISLVFVANIVIYWTSPEVFPRYILMLIPLLFGVFAFLYLDQQKERSLPLNLIEWIFGGLITVSILLGIGIFFIDLPLSPRHIYMTASFLILFFILLTYLFWMDKLNRLIWVVMFLLIFRIGFDLLVIPARLADSEEIIGKELAREIAVASEGSELKFYWDPDIDPEAYYGYRVTSYRFNYYLVMFRDEVVYLTHERNPNGMYITKAFNLKDPNVEVLKTFKPPGQPTDLVLFRFLAD